ncbi:AsnC family transcriptional regulator [Streptomyces cirratus]
MAARAVRARRGAGGGRGAGPPAGHLLGEAGLGRDGDPLSDQGAHPRRPRRPAAGQAPAHPPGDRGQRPHAAAGLRRRPGAVVRAGRAAARPGRGAGAAAGPAGRERHTLDEAELALLSVLGRDGRAGYPELARASGLSESTARRRLERLRELGALYLDVELVPTRLGYEAEATLMLTAAPARLRRRARRSPGTRRCRSPPR